MPISINELQNKSPFGATYRQGKSLKTIQEARKYFQDVHGVVLCEYVTTRDTPSRPKTMLPKDALLSCSICERPRWGVDKSPDDITGSGVPFVVARQHHMFMDTDGKIWPTCYKLNFCYRTVNFDPAAPFEIKLPVPSFEEFIDLDESVTKEFREAVEDNYLKVVLPFMIKWSNLEITKMNVDSFVSEWAAVEISHLRFYDDYRGENKIRNKIMRIIGVKV